MLQGLVCAAEPSSQGLLETSGPKLQSFSLEASRSTAQEPAQPPVSLCVTSEQSPLCPDTPREQQPQKFPLQEHLPSVNCVPEEDPADSFIVRFLFFFFSFLSAENVPLAAGQ